jgi:hypothetical protein
MLKTTKNYKKNNKVKKSKSSKQSITKIKSKSKTLTSIASMSSLLDFKKNKSLTTLSKPSDIKSMTSVGEFYNLLEMHDNINKHCINKVKTKVVDGIQLNKKVSKDICNCLFEKNKNLSIEKLEEKTNKKINTPGSSCISILDKFIQEEKNKQTKKNSKTLTLSK